MEQMDAMNNLVTLTDEEGNDVEFEVLDIIAYEGKAYVVFLPAEESEEADEVVILQAEPNENPELETYASVEDPDALAAVFEIFKERFKDEFNFVD